MIVAALILMLGVQETPQPPLPAGDPNPGPRSDRLEDLEQRRQPLPASTPAGLRAIQQFGACVADASTAKARTTLSGDFRTPAYRRAMDQMVEANRMCPSFRGYNRLRASRLLFAGAVAERLIERDGVPVNRELAKAATKPAASSYSPTDTAAMCVVRSVPDDVAKLFATEIATPAEQSAAAGLQPAMAMCMNSRRVEVTTDGLRAMLATAAFRSIHAASAAPKG
ncbi:hypothetical protein [Sphingomonas sp. LT1P40]|uniref:hypothetical protein n=1 Tax=Alteristakelama amylovorans TaxID=3096166 RepID=UPI002FCADFD1